MSCSITTRVGWCTWSTFCEGPSSGPGVVLDCRLGVEGGRRTRLKGSRHRCSGSGGLACGDHVACRGGEAGSWLRTESRRLLWCRGVELSSWGARGTMRAAMTSSRTTARTRREAFSKGEGAPRGCSFGRLGLLAPHNAPARGWRHRRCRPGVLESPGKSMGEAAAPGSPWGIPGSSLGWGGSGGAGSEGQPLPWGSTLHGPPEAPGSPRFGALGRVRAPSPGYRERVSPLCRRGDRRSPCLSRENLGCSGPSSPTARASWGLCPCRFRPEIPGISWDPSPRRLSFRRISPRGVAEHSEAILAHTGGPPSHLIP